MPVCSKEMLDDICEVLVRDFKAKYVVVGKERRAAYGFFEEDARFDKTLETNHEAVYVIE